MLPRIPTSPPPIKPVDENVVRPKWSVMIPVYNCSQFLPDAIESVLLQNIPAEEMQIEVVDDASTDADVEEIVKTLGKGRIAYYRQPQNVGSLSNFETCINRSKGEIVHLLHGDDRVKAGYYSKVSELFSKFTSVGAAFCRYNYIDEHGKKKFTREPEMNEDGILENWLCRIAEVCSVQYVSIAVKREVYEKLGAFYGLFYGEDWEMWVRMAKVYSVAYTPDVLAEYREHNTSITGVKFLNGGIMKDTRRVFDLIQQYLPASERRSVIKKGRKKSAHYGLQITQNVWYSTANFHYLNSNARQVLLMNYADPFILKQLLKLYIQMFKRVIKRAIKSF